MEMIISKPISNQSSAVARLVVTRNQGPMPFLDSAVTEYTICRSHLDQVVQQIESPRVREIVGIVFRNLLRLLECLSLIESHLRQFEKAEETRAFFQLIHGEARALVVFIQDNALHCAAMPEEVTETLDGITFAVNHDLQRVFDHDLGNQFSAAQTQVVIGKLCRMHDVLTNCLQQSTISLALVFDTNLVGAKLFNNSALRYRQSLQLCQDLAALRQLVENFEEKSERPALSSLIAGIEKFRNKSMEFLMYSDWPLFESFCERIALSPPDGATLAPLLHQFRCYLETLLGQVKMRAVLTNGPMQFGEANTSHFWTMSNNEVASLSESFDLEDEEAA